MLMRSESTNAPLADAGLRSRGLRCSWSLRGAEIRHRKFDETKPNSDLKIAGQRYPLGAMLMRNERTKTPPTDAGLRSRRLRFSWSLRWAEIRHRKFDETKPNFGLENRGAAASALRDVDAQRENENAANRRRPAVAPPRSVLSQVSYKSRARSRHPPQALAPGCSGGHGPCPCPRLP